MIKKLSYVLIILFVLLIAAGIAIGSVLLNRNGGFSKEITLSGTVVHEELGVSLDGMVPGKTVSYMVSFKGEISQTYDVSLVFTPAGDCTLADYIDVNVTLDGKQLNAGKLNAYLSGDAINLGLSATEKDKSVLEITYTMPAEVGNEAQGASAAFNVEITAGQKGAE